MEKLVYKSIDETVYHETLSNGLNVYLIKKEGFNEKCAFYGAKFGSFQTGGYLIDNDGIKHEVVGGIAHFLEHRLFDYYKGNVMDLYDDLGAYTNAFTTFNRTVYYFSTITNFEKCLDLLLDFPATFEMSEEAVNKEKDIIVQELLMYKDRPERKIFQQTLNNLYFDHPIKFDVGGEPEEVRGTTRDLLKLCQQTFYSPSNMYLVVAGDIDVDETLKLIEENQMNKTFKTSRFEEKVIKENYNNAVKDYEETNENISNDKLMIAYKLKPFEKDVVKNQLCLELITDLLFDSSTDFYEYLIKNELASNIEGEYMGFNNLNTLMFEADITDSEKVIRLVKNRVENAVNLINDKDLDNLKKNEISSIIKTCDSCRSLASYFCSCLFENTNYFNFVDIIKSITVEDLKDVYNNYLKDAVSTTCVLRGEKND